MSEKEIYFVENMRKLHQKTTEMDRYELILLRTTKKLSGFHIQALSSNVDIKQPHTGRTTNF